VPSGYGFVLVELGRADAGLQQFRKALRLEPGNVAALIERADLFTDDKMLDLAIADLKAAARCPDSHAIYRSLVELEIESTFSFQDRQWLCDIAPEVLDESTRRRAENAKQRAARREAAEQWIPAHLLYEKGWPRMAPTARRSEPVGADRV
jgi:tetratricopeptide (TPR) repeat protein